jgi:hypothetical protein
MQPRQMARPASFGPDALKVIYKAYDDAWNEIAPKVSTEPCAVEWAKMSLATIMLGLANADSVTHDGLRAMAVVVFCAKHRIDAGVTAAAVSAQTCA